MQRRRWGSGAECRELGEVQQWGPTLGRGELFRCKARGCLLAVSERRARALRCMATLCCQQERYMPRAVAVRVQAWRATLSLGR